MYVTYSLMKFTTSDHVNIADFINHIIKFTEIEIFDNSYSFTLIIEIVI